MYTGNVTRQDIINASRQWIGTPYHHQGRVKGVGVDCCGLVIGVARELGLSDYDVFGYSPHADGVSLLSQFARNCEKVDNPQPGDILIFRIRHNPSHCGISADYPWGKTVIHAYQSIDAVKEHILDPWWSSKIVAAFRFPGVEG